MKNISSLTSFLITLAAVIIILAGIKMAVQIVVPFLLSLFIAIICSPLIRILLNRKVPLGIAITIIFALILMIFFFLASLVGSAVNEFNASIPQYRSLLAQRISDITAFAHHWNIPLSISREAVLEKFDPSIIMNFVSRILLSFSGVLTNMFVILLVVVFMLLELPTAKHRFALALSQGENVQQKESQLEQVLQSVISYLGIKTIMSLLTAICIWILLAIMDVQYAVLWATLSFLLNYIPNIGSIIAAIPIVVQGLLLNGFQVGFAVLLGIVIINVAIGNIIEPKMMGKKLGLSTLVVFLSLLFWGWLLGTVGMLLSVPLTMALKIALESSPNTYRYAALLGDVAE